MKIASFLCFLPAFLSIGAASPIDEAAEYLRNGDAVGVLRTLSGEESEESCFWKGRALIELDRMKEAADFLAKVSDTHKLYPYAAKALLYCAWQSPDVEFSTVVPTLAASRNPEIAEIAAAALAEFWLQQPESQDNTALELLRGMAAKNPEFTPVLELLEIENLRQKGKYDDAINLCRKLEGNRELPADIRQRVRLALAEVFYAQETAGFTGKEDSTAGLLSGLSQAEPENDEEAENAPAEGKGEETLLHFISTHPESPLLPEAFRRLAAHQAFTRGKYARARLQEWIEDIEKPRRAAISLLILQYLINRDNPDSVEPDNTCANTALTLFPGESATQLILLEQTRYLLEQGLTEEAAKYLSHVTLDSPHKTFYSAVILAETNVQQAAFMFRDCARLAPEDLRPAAFANSLLCALRSGNKELETEILNYPYFTPEARVEVYAALFLYHMGKDSVQARQALQVLQSIPYRASDFMVDFLLDKAWFNMDDSPLMVEQELAHTSTANFRPRQLLRYYMIREEAMRKASPADRKAETEERIAELMRQAIESTGNRHLNYRLRFHLAHLFSERSMHAEAFRQLMDLHQMAGNGDAAAQSLFHAAYEKEQVGTTESLKEAAAMYANCAEKYPELVTQASIRQADVLIRIGQGEEAEHILKHLLSKEEQLTPQERAYTLITLSNKYTLEGTTEGMKRALEVGGQCAGDTSLPPYWRYAALLHHAAICSRSGHYRPAYDDYMAILEMNPVSKASATDRDWSVFHQAAIGAVDSLLELKQFREAANLADRFSDWMSDRKMKRYAEWATYIRQTNFLRNE